MKRLKAIFLLMLNGIVWLIVFIFSLPFVLLYKAWTLCKRIFVRAK